MKKILVIGAGFLQQFIIKKAKKLGYYVIAIDGDENAIGFEYADAFAVIDIKDYEKCAAYAKENNINGVITGATDYGVITTAYIAQEMKLPGLKYDIAKLIKDKYYVTKKIYHSGNTSLKQLYRVENLATLLKLKKKLKYPLMIKPVDGSGSRGVFKIENEKELLDLFNVSLECSNEGAVLIEDYFIGVEYGADIFVYDNEIHVYGPIGKEMTQAPHYAELGHFYPSKLVNVEKIREKLKNVIQILNVNFGAVNIDFLVDKDENIFIVDIGARMGGNIIGSHIIPIAFGIDYMGNLIKASVGDKVDVKKSEKSYAISTKILALTPGFIKEVPNNKMIEEKYDVHILDNVYIGKYINAYKTNLDGLGYLYSYGDDIEQVKTNTNNSLLEYNNQIVRKGEI